MSEAVTTAKTFVANLLKEEGARDIGLEEVKFSEAQDAWLVTIGFARAWDTPHYPR